MDWLFLISHMTAAGVWPVCLGFVTWNGCFVLQRCWKTGVLVGLPGVCDMKCGFCVTKVLECWCFGRFSWCL